MHGPIATILPDPSGPVTARQGMYLSDVWAIRSDGREQVEFTTIAAFDTLVESGNVGYVMFGHFDFPRRAVRDIAKARTLVIKLLRQYERGEWGRFRDLATGTVEPTLSEREPSGPDEIVPLTSGYALHRYSRFWHLVDAEGTIEVWEDGRPDDAEITRTIAALPPIVEAWACPQCGRELPSAEASCVGCAPSAPPTITGPVPTEGDRKDATYYEVVVTFPGFPARRYQLHDEYSYGVNERAPGGWSPTNITVAALDLPPETIQALREIWDSLFRSDRSAPVQPTRPAQPPQPTYTLAEQLAALRTEAHAASRQGLTEVVNLLKDRAAELAEQYLDLNCMCDQGHYLNEYGQCETCLEAAQQLACARAHVDATIRRWEFEAETSGVPF